MNVGDFPLTTLVETTRDGPAWCEITDSCYAWPFEGLASLTFDSALEPVRGLRLDWRCGLQEQPSWSPGRTWLRSRR